MIYLRYDVCFADDIRFAYEDNGYYIILAVSKYIMRQSRISYCESNISLKNVTFNDINIQHNLDEANSIYVEIDYSVNINGVTTINKALVKL